MINEIAPEVFDNTFKILSPCSNDYAFFFQNSSFLSINKNGENSIPLFDDYDKILSLGGEFSKLNAVYQFSIDNSRYFLITIDTDKQNLFLEKNWTFISMKELRSFAPKRDAFAAVTCSQLWRWKESRRFCGKCGTENIPSTTERAFVCPKCKNIEYPKISPAIIVAITDGKRLLMARNAKASYSAYALIAGFVEIGESFEECVRREVKEEVGLKIKNIRYYKNQPWGFSDTQMIGFFAELDGSDKITLQESELTEAKWFNYCDIPEPPSTISISQTMIHMVKNGKV